MLAESSEFENMQVRDDELLELDHMAIDLPFDIRGGSENKHGKVAILLQVISYSWFASKRNKCTQCDWQSWYSGTIPEIS